MMAVMTVDPNNTPRMLVSIAPENIDDPIASSKKAMERFPPVPYVVITAVIATVHGNVIGG